MKNRRLTALLMTVVIVLSMVNIGVFADETVEESVISAPPAATPVVTNPQPEVPIVPEQSSESPEVPEQPSESPAVPEQSSESPEVPEQPSESPAVPEQPSESPAMPEQPVESPEVTAPPEASPAVSPTPVSAEMKLYGDPTPEIKISPSGSFVALDETLSLTLEVTGTVKNISVVVTDPTLGTVNYDGAVTVVFTPSALGTAVITVSGEDEGGSPVNAMSSVNIANKYNVTFSSVNNTAGLYTGPSTVYGGQTYSFTFKSKGEDFDCYEYYWKTYTDENPAVNGPDKDGNFKINIPAVITPNGGAPDNTLMIELTGSKCKQYTISADSSADSAAWETLLFPQNDDMSIKKGTYKTDYVLRIDHTKDEGGDEATVDTDYIYSLPTMKRTDRDGNLKDYYGFYIERDNSDAEHPKAWTLTIPGEDITGDIVIYADKTKKEVDDPLTPEEEHTTVFHAISFHGKSDTTVDDMIAGLSVFSKEALDVSEDKARDYYFCLRDAISVNREVKYTVGTADEPKIPEKVGKSLYKIAKEDLTDDIYVSIIDPNVFAVTKQGSGKGEEVLIELSSNIAPRDTAYTFKVKHHENTQTSLQLHIYINGVDHINDVSLTLSGEYWIITVPAALVIGDISITALCLQDVRCSVIFEDAYYAAEEKKNYRFTAFKIVLVTEKDGIITRTLLNAQTDPNFKKIKIDPDTKKIRVELDPYEKFRFEVVCPNPNSVGKYYTDPNTGCYLYNFINSKMGGKTIGYSQYIQDTPVYTFDTDTPIIEQPGNTYHLDYNLGEITGDATIKVKPLMAKYGVSTQGNAANGITLSKSYATYRVNYNFTNSNGEDTDLYIYVGGKRLSLNSGYSYENGNSSKIIIEGGYIKGDIVISAEKYVEDNYYSHTSTAITSSQGTEYGLGVSTFRTLDNGYYIYAVTAEGTPKEDMYPCFDGYEMIYYEPYGAYVRLVVSNDSPEVFERNMDDLFDELSEEELELQRAGRISSGKTTEESEYALKEAIDGYTVLGDLNGDGKVDGEDVSIARKLYMNRSKEIDGKALAVYLLSDVNASQTIDMKDVAKIRRLAQATDKTSEKERSFMLTLSVDGESKVTVNQDDEIEVKLKLIRTDKNKEDDAAVSAVQDEIHFDGKFLKLLKDTELADGVEMNTSKITEGKKTLECISISYVEDEDSVELGRETMLAVFRFKVLDNDDSSIVSNNNAFVTADDGETVYSCHLTDLTVKSEKILPPMCVVTFNYMGAAEDDVIEIIEGSLLSTPIIIPEYDGFVFDGWYKDEEYTEPWDFENDIVETNITLYAKWTPVRGLNPIWIAVIAVAVLAAGGAAVLIYRRRYY